MKAKFVDNSVATTQSALAVFTCSGEGRRILCRETSLHFISSFTARDMYVLEGQVPETVVRGETRDISHWASLKW
jgi:hypothetical protein